MSRQMPGLASRFRAYVAGALDLVYMGQRLRVDPVIGKRVRSELTPHRESVLYEMAYLRVFNAWEILLEECFLRYLCGYEFMGAAERPACAYASNLAAAKTAVYRQQQYLLWHNPSKTISRANTHFLPNNRIAMVIGSALTDIDDYAAVRHRIAHDHLDARQKFDTATMRLTARRFPGGRPGAFLKYATTSGTIPVCWLERICTVRRTAALTSSGTGLPAWGRA